MKTKILSISTTLNNNLALILKKLDFLENPSKGNIPSNINAMIVFGSNMNDVTSTVISLIENHSQLKNVPIIVSRNKHEEIDEANEFKKNILQNPSITKYTGEILFAEKAVSTQEGVYNTLAVLERENIKLNNLLYINFPIHCRAGQHEFKALGLTEEQVFTVPAKINKSNITLNKLARWIDFHYQRFNTINDVTQNTLSWKLRQAVKENNFEEVETLISYFGAKAGLMEWFPISEGKHPIDIATPQIKNILLDYLKTNKIEELDYAIYNNDLARVDELLKLGYRLYINKDNALIYARLFKKSVKFNRPQMVQLLLNAGAPTDLKIYRLIKEDITPLDYAIENGYNEVVEIIKKGPQP